jgi:hypothetical protein
MEIALVIVNMYLLYTLRLNVEEDTSAERGKVASYGVHSQKK